ncbi:gamma-glutamyl-gamma-aminobutyrate hydrolase family protein [Microbacterium mangrovi]|uniref:gamma-glutamyl-gamma-aminobutyrate hydrolase family protein n=1 Tax=Microbacterium mangrovi TaxID=1348253 RepID=UPI00068C8B75|nr:gamma-glutamyl-gamma-aminobutyrate hydrolase family protein [Microbacterium mangrovi]
MATIAIPARLSDGAVDPRIDEANRIFADVVRLAEAEGLDVEVVDSWDAAADASRFAGLILPGGGDIDPAQYGGEASDALYDVNPAQDELDFGIARAALDAGIPVLGICRGLQVLNVIHGGTLVEDLPETDVEHGEGPAAGSDGIAWAWHPVALQADSALADAVGSVRMPVASGHHQGIGTLGDGLVATAVAEDGLVEAFERPDRTVIAVQWHPEALDTPPQLAAAPFSAFAAQVRTARGAQQLPA